MVTQSVRGNLLSKPKDFEELMYTERLDIHRSMNQYRWEKYQNRESLFGVKYGGTYPKENLKIPKSDQFNIVQENAKYAWAPVIWNAIKVGEVSIIHDDDNLLESNPDIDLPSINKNLLTASPSDYSYAEGVITVYSPDGSTFIEIELENPIKINEDVQIKIEYNQNPVFVYYDYPSRSDASSNMNNLRHALNKKQQAAYAFLVASRAVPVGQIELGDSPEDFFELFGELDLHHTELPSEDGTTVFLVTNTSRGKTLIDKYKNSNLPYYDLFGFPEDIKLFIENGEDRYTDGYDRYPSEEFVVYLLEDNDISGDEASYIELCPYRSPPTKEGARYAIQLGKQVEQSVIEFSRVTDQNVEPSDVFDGIRPSEKGKTIEKPIYLHSQWPV